VPPSRPRSLVRSCNLLESLRTRGHIVSTQLHLGRISERRCFPLVQCKRPPTRSDSRSTAHDHTRKLGRTLVQDLLWCGGPVHSGLPSHVSCVVNRVLSFLELPTRV
jgi:hypothetical protein